MKKYIFVLDVINVMAKLLKEKRVEGVLFLDENTSRLTFKAYNRQPRKRDKDRMVKKLPWGWVKESKANQKRYTSFPKNMSLEEKLALMDRDNEMAKAVLIERELELIEFC
jgi:hypothetical protein